MKRNFVIAALLIFVVGIYLFANVAVTRIAARALPPLLEDIQGEAVTVSGLRANVWRLRAYADSVVYGDPGAPRARGTGVELDLDGASLLRGEIRLNTVSAQGMDIHPSRWPESAPDSAPTDLDTVDRWLPEVLRVSTLRFMRDETVLYQASDVVWRILSSTARHAEWRTARGDADLRYIAETPDWPAIRTSQGINAHLLVVRQQPQQQTSKLLTVEINGKPADDGFDLRWVLEAQGVQASLGYHVATLFEMPAASRLEVAHLDVGKLLQAVALVEQSSAGEVSEPSPDKSILEQPLPALSLPAQQVQLVIDELNVGDETVRDLTADVVVSAAEHDAAPGVAVSNLQAELPVADLKGSVLARWDTGWRGSVDLSVETRSRKPEESRLFDNADWLWKSGNVQLETHGNTIRELMEQAVGRLDVLGAYRAGSELPARLHAVLDDRPGRVGADELEFAVGSSSMKGSIWFDESADDMVLVMHASRLDVVELLPPDRSNAVEAPGYELPDYAWWTSRMHIDGRFTSDVTRLPSATLRALDARLLRTQAGAQLIASFAGVNGGTFNLQANTIIQGSARRMSVKLQVKDLPAGAMVLDTPATVSGSLGLDGHGASYAELVSSLTGQVDASLHYAATKGEIHVSGLPKVIASDGRLTGVSLDHLELSTGAGPIASGTLSYDDSVPRITGELSSPSVDMDALLAALPARLKGSAPEPAGAGSQPAASTTPAPEAATSLVSALDGLPPTSLSFSAASMTLFDQTLTSFSLDLELDPGKLDVRDLHFGSDYGAFQGSSQISGDAGSLQVAAEGGITRLNLTDLLPEERPVGFQHPLGGKFSVTTHGADWQSLATNLRAEVKLDNDRTDADALQIAMMATRAGPGVRLDIEQFRIGPSDLHGMVTFTRGEPSTLAAKLQSTSFDLTHWGWLEEIDTRAARKKSTREVSSVADISEDAFHVLGNMIAAPFHLFSGAGESSSDRFFSTEKFKVGLLQELDGSADLSFGELKGGWGHARNFTVSSSLHAGKLTLDLKSDEVNGGSASVDLTYDASVSPPRASLVSNLKNFRPSGSETAAPRSAFISFTATGDSQATLAASSNGELFLESGAGTADYAHFGLGIFSASLMNQVFGLLSSNHETSPPKLDCAVGYANVTNGVLETPKAAVLQTPLANVLWRIKVDLGKETINAQFDSRSRTGAGLSVANVLSQTVRLSGPLTSPHILPNTTGILWRGWAALATGGLSLLGESFIKRMLASDHACANLRREIEKQVCGTGTAAASSPLVCPDGQ